MPQLKEFTLADILSKLPEAEVVGESEFVRRDDLFLCALGFEDRCPAMAERAVSLGGYTAGECIVFTYGTNMEDNEANRSRLSAALRSISGEDVCPIDCDSEEFSASFRGLVKRFLPTDRVPRVAFDVSVCSSRLLITVLTVLLDWEVELRLYYSEANIYHPTKEEYAELKAEWINSDRVGSERGVGRVFFSKDHPGVRSDQVPEAIVLFPTFKPERTRAVLAAVDDVLLEGTAKRVVWIVGKPHLDNDYWRARAMREINSIGSDSPCYEISTFDYRNTLQCLERVYSAWDNNFNVTISPLGSKLQSVGCALFWYMHQDISFVFSVPKSYNAKSYSEGRKALWKIDFGEISLIKSALNQVGQLFVIG